MQPAVYWPRALSSRLLRAFFVLPTTCASSWVVGHCLSLCPIKILVFTSGT